MQETHCPLCYEALEVRDVAPCHDCGALPDELNHLRQGDHTYEEYEVFPDMRIVLCNICALEFRLYPAEYFGLPRNTRVGFPDMRLIRTLHDPQREVDKCCPTCGRRLVFLHFVIAARERHAQQNPAADMDADCEHEAK